MKKNIIGRTKIQQEKIELDIIAKGSLWPKLEILHKFDFTTKEFNLVQKSKQILQSFSAKLNNL